MSKLPRMALWLSFLSLAGVIEPALAEAEPLTAGAIGCAVGKVASELDGDALCQGLAAELGRSVVRVDDAHAVRRGAALQVLRGDAEWFVAWLRDGQITAWTRVSHKSARGHELQTIVRASSSLAKRARDLDGHCIELGRILEQANASSDLVYPWQELYSCKGYTTDLVDPWLASR